MTLSWFGILLITLLLTTAFWAVLLYESRQEYDRYTELFYDWAYLEAERIYEEYGYCVDYGARSYWYWSTSKTIILMGFVLLCSWILTAREKWREFKASG